MHTIFDFRLHFSRFWKSIYINQMVSTRAASNIDECERICRNTWREKKEYVFVLRAFDYFDNFWWILNQSCCDPFAKQYRNCSPNFTLRFGGDWSSKFIRSFFSRLFCFILWSKENTKQNLKNRKREDKTKIRFKVVPLCVCVCVSAVCFSSVFIWNSFQIKH